MVKGATGSSLAAALGLHSNNGEVFDRGSS